MASSSGGHGWVMLRCTNPNPNPNQIEPGTKHLETLISTADIHDWEFSTILRHQTIRIQAHQNRLVEQSCYFHGLLSGCFSESSLECIPIHWGPESFLNLLRFIYGCPVDITSHNFLSLFEPALYFGVETLLSKCKSWLSEVAYNRAVAPAIQLDDLIQIWSFGLEYANDFVPELCAGYLARNFMWASSSKFFGNVPSNLLLRCIKHPHLTVDSEMHLSNGLVVWIHAKTKQLEPLRNIDQDCIEILKEIRISLLPVWYAAGRRRCSYFSTLATDSIRAIVKLMRVPPTASIDVLGDGNLDHLRIRLTEYSKKVNLSGCPQLTAAIVRLSLLPGSNSLDVASKKSLEQLPIDLDCLTIDQSGSPHGFPPSFLFEAVEEVDISRCHRLHLEVSAGSFFKAFPSLIKLKAAYLLHFRTATVLKLVQKCSRISEVDLTVDITPLIPGQVSVISSSPIMIPTILRNDMIAGNNSLDMRQSFSNITRLTLEGRTDIVDSGLQSITEFCVSLNYINLKGCIAVTDAGISNLVHRCFKLHSILACDTSFGLKSILALCASSNLDSSPSEHVGKRGSNALAFKLQTLHIGGCKGIDERSLLELLAQAQTLKSLCLRATNLVDEALYSFSGSLLEALDVSNTMVSRAALAHIVFRNPMLKCFMARDCKNLIQQESNNTGMEISSSCPLLELYTGLGKQCRLEEISFGWGFSYLSLSALGPAIVSLRVLSVGLGASLGEDALRLLPTTCPMLMKIYLYFQVISDCIVTNIFASLMHLEVLVLCYCVGDISISSFNLPLRNIKKLWLHGVTPWLTINDLGILTQNLENLVDLSLLGCRLLNSDCLRVITHGWPGLSSIHIEDCGEITANGVSPLFNCTALEDLVLRHNGAGIHKDFILEAASKLPILRQVSLDLCDAIDGDLDIPDFHGRYYLSVVKIARCKFHVCSSIVAFSEDARMPVHKETLVLVWNSESLVRTVVKERL